MEILISVLFGAAIGRVFKVWILIPALAGGFAIIFACTASHEHNLLAAFIEGAIIIACVQAGYALSSLARWS